MRQGPASSPTIAAAIDQMVSRIVRRGRYARRLRSNFIFGKYRYSLCPAPRAGSHYYRIRAELWSGGMSGRRQAGTLNVCAGGNDYPGGGKFDRDRNRAVTWRRGASVAGVGLNARSGFSRWVKVAYRFGGPRGSKHRLCGSGGRDEIRAARIFSGEGRGGRPT
jgi:hypothetical protein